MLSRLTRKGSSQQIELMPQLDVDRLAETLVAFANSDGGTVIFGIGQNREPATEVPLPEEIEYALHAALLRCQPIVNTEWQAWEEENVPLYGVRVPRSSELHSLDDGRVLVRSSAKNQPLGGEAIRHLAATKSSGDFEMEVVAGATWDDMDESIIASFQEKWEERHQHRWASNGKALLRSFGVITDRGEITVAGLLLFGKEPQFFLPQADLIFVRSRGRELRGPNGLPGYEQRLEVKGPLPRLLEESWYAIFKEMRTRAVVRNLKREEEPEYPPFAVREALVNAVAHRDYRLRGRRIEVRLFSDRLEVSSPGGLPGYITLDNIVEEHFSRNPRLVNVLFQWGYIEALGLGIDRMIEDMVNSGHPQPRFRATTYNFTVVLLNAQVTTPIPVNDRWTGEKGLNRRQILALNYMQQNQRITSREYRQLSPEVSAETLRLDMAALVERGLVLKIGNKKGTYYVLK